MKPIWIKPGCDFTGMHPDIVMWAGVVAGYHLNLTGRPLWITSARRRYRPGVVSRHSPPPCTIHGDLCSLQPDLRTPDCMPVLVTGFDFRRWYLDEVPGRAEEFCTMLQGRHSGYLGVVLEPEWLTKKQIKDRGGIEKIAPHIHCQTKLEVFKEFSLYAAAPLWSGT